MPCLVMAHATSHLIMAHATPPSNGRLRRCDLLCSDIAVVVGIERPDWALLQMLSPGAAVSSVFSATGSHASVASGRISFVLGLVGPCFSVDTACSSSLVALHSAGRAVAGLECGRALTASASLILQPGFTLNAASAGMLSERGRCKTFDHRCDGMVRSEGVGSVLLAATTKTSSVLRATIVSQDGRSASLTSPSGSAQCRLIVTALYHAGLASHELGTVFSHGTGTPLGDPIEVESTSY